MNAEQRSPLALAVRRDRYSKVAGSNPASNEIYALHRETGSDAKTCAEWHKWDLDAGIRQYSAKYLLEVTTSLIRQNNTSKSKIQKREFQSLII